MTVMTGAVKNLFGCIPGKRKAQWHLNTGVDHGHFMQLLLELSALIKPRITIIDAVIGMEGNGPGSGDPRRIGAVLAGRDAVAVDVVSALLVGAVPEKLPIIRAALQQGFGEARPECIRVLGERVDDMKIADFRFPPQGAAEFPMPEWLKSSLKNALTTRPVINADECIVCGVCQGHCPRNAIERTGNRLSIRYRDCIRCFCCQEFCPQGAITVGKGWASRILS
jgi:Pyruvate/2-oxoacid:ferredoxin oxidoreductase delta subunit